MLIFPESPKPSVLQRKIEVLLSEQGDKKQPTDISSLSPNYSIITECYHVTRKVGQTLNLSFLQAHIPTHFSSKVHLDFSRSAQWLSITRKSNMPSSPSQKQPMRAKEAKDKMSVCQCGASNASPVSEQNPSMGSGSEDVNIPRHMSGPTRDIIQRLRLGWGPSLLWQAGLRKRVCPMLESHSLCSEGWQTCFSRKKKESHLSRRELHILWMVWTAPGCHFLNYVRSLIYPASFLGSPSHSLLTGPLGELISDFFKEAEGGGKNLKELWRSQFALWVLFLKFGLFVSLIICHTAFPDRYHVRKNRAHTWSISLFLWIHNLL